MSVIDTDLCATCRRLPVAFIRVPANGDAPHPVCASCRRQAVAHGTDARFIELERRTLVDATEPEVEAPPSLFDGPDFDGDTYRRDRDHQRLGKQLTRVADALSNGEWWTLAELHAHTGDPEASVSARLRDLRKGKFGGYLVDHENVGGGVWRYRLRKDQP